jgi:septum formation protein
MADQTSTSLILASRSPRRAELLNEAGYSFRVEVAQVEEPPTRERGLIPQHWAEALSYFKAREVARRVPDGVVLAADTIVAYGERIFGKADDEDDARRIITTLMGTEHQVITGVTVLHSRTGERRIAHAVTRVTMKRMQSEVIDAYVSSGAWKGKAGAYGIQDNGDPHVDCIDGSDSNVAGLPMDVVSDLLAQFKIHPSQPAS